MRKQGIQNKRVQQSDDMGEKAVIEPCGPVTCYIVKSATNHLFFSELILFFPPHLLSLFWKSFQRPENSTDNHPCCRDGQPRSVGDKLGYVLFSCLGLPYGLTGQPANPFTSSSQPYWAGTEHPASACA